MLLVDALRGRRQCSTTVITRPPEFEWHRKSLNVLQSNLRPFGYYCDALHTKLYAFECPGFSLVMFGSPNMTARANETNVELAVELRGVANHKGDDISRVMAELLQYANDLSRDESVRHWDL